MDIRFLKKSAGDALAQAKESPARLVLIHNGAAVCVTVAVTLITFYLNKQMNAAPGLAGLTTRTTLSFISMLLTAGSSLLIPFWELGYLRAALCHGRKEEATVSTLFEGFRRFLPSLRLFLLLGALLLAVGFFCLQAATTIFMLTPFSNAFAEAADKLLSAEAVLDAATLESLLPHMFPMYIIFGILLLIVLVPMLYKYRLAQWSIMDNAPGALAAMGMSVRAMRHRRWELFRLDVSFWWFYALQLLIPLLSYADLLLSYVGVKANTDVIFWACFLAGQGLQLFLAWRFLPKVQTTYALAYDCLTKPQTP